MRLLRVLTVAVGLATLLSQPSAAQGDRLFKDSWFWGIKGGGLLYSSEVATNASAPVIGGEWLITRSTGGLYLSFDQAFFTTQGGYLDRDPDSTRAFIRKVDLENLRRFTIAGMVFPAQSRTLHPYVGFGLTLNQIASAALAGPIATSRFGIAQDSIQARKAAFSPILMGGAQYRLPRASVFAQVSASPSQRSFFLSSSGSTSVNLSLEVGARYNVGSAIDRQR
ncbi:MAG: hypothetical protein V4550_20580 [Gemmatimonadota bacterium]